MNISKVPDILDHQLESFPMSNSISTKKEDNSSYSCSTEELKQTVNRFTMGLLKRGFKKGDKISLISYNNRPEWNIADLGMLQLGVINVSVYPNISPDDYVYIFNNAKIKYCIVGYGNLLEKVLCAQAKIPSLERIFTFDKPLKQKDYNNNPVENWEVLLEEHPDQVSIEEAKNNVTEDDLATIIYTSGTTGIPKGVMLSHGNIVSNIKAISDVILLDKGDSALSYLPICHGFERTFVYCYIYKCLRINYALSHNTLIKSLQEIRPHIMTAVPGILEKVYEKIVSSMQKAGGLKRSLFFRAEKLTHHYDFNQKPGMWCSFQLWLADNIIFSGIRNKFGGRLKVIGVGASACPEKILKFFCAAGIPVREGYGLTETSAVLSVNQIPGEKAMIGTVGIPLPGFEIKIKNDTDIYENGIGEIFVRGRSVSEGYYNDPVNTAQTFNKDGWLLTGDIGTLVKNKYGFEFIKLIDRKKELMKSSNGKYVAPMAIENLLRESFFVSQVLVIGEKRSYVSVLIIPEFDTLNEWLVQNKIEFSVKREIISLNEVKDKFKKITDDANRHLSKPEQIRKFTLIPDNWSVETGELTPTLKLKRKVIESKYADIIEQMYNDDGS